MRPLAGVGLRITNGWRLRGLRPLRRTRRGCKGVGEVIVVSKVIPRWMLWRGGSPTWKRYPASASELQALQELVVIGVRADPEPDPVIVAAPGQSPVVE